MSPVPFMPAPKSSQSPSPKPPGDRRAGARPGLIPVRVSLVSLGCAKNRVDSEGLLGCLAGEGFALAAPGTEADLALVNTCGFLQASKEESLEVILDCIERKTRGELRWVVVAGCLYERYAVELERELPGVDLFLGFDGYGGAGARIKALVDGRAIPPVLPAGERFRGYPRDLDRVLTTPRSYAYLRIAEGCNRRCAFCAIPSIRGKLASKPIPDLVEEARRLARLGVREGVLVSDDTTDYGRDLYGKPRLVELLRELSRIHEIRRWRMLYTYPTGFNDALLEELATNPRLCGYVDVPLQHAHDDTLRRMRRGMTRRKIEALLERLRGLARRVAIRTTFVVGFPGESREEFQALLDMVAQWRFDRLGSFVYSREEGTAGAAMEGGVALRTRVARRRRLMELQQRIAFELGRARVGEECELLVDGPAPGRPGWVEARSEFEAPEIDGTVYLRAAPRSGAPAPRAGAGAAAPRAGATSRSEAAGPGLEAGRLLRARIVAAEGYDWRAEVVAGAGKDRGLEEKRT